LKKLEEKLLLIDARLAELERLKEEMESAKKAVEAGEIVVLLGGGVLAIAEVKRWLVDAGGGIYIENTELLERRLQRVSEERERLLEERRKLVEELKKNVA